MEITLNTPKKVVLQEDKRVNFRIDSFFLTFFNMTL